MKIIITVGLIMLGSFCSAQKQSVKDKQDIKSKEVFRAIPPENKARPEYDLSAYLSNSLQYPDAAREAEIKGKVVVEFIIDKDGSVDGVRVVKGQELGGGLPEEAIRVVKNMPPWRPATQNGQLVKSYMTLPVDFKLNDDPVLLDSRYQFPVDKSITLSQGALPTFDYTAYREKQLVYPEKARVNAIQGLIVVKFIVEEDAKISNIAIVEGQRLGYGLPEEALRLIRNMPAWQPALDNNKKPVRSYVIVPVVFELNDK